MENQARWQMMCKKDMRSKGPRLCINGNKIKERPSQNLEVLGKCFKKLTEVIINGTTHRKD